jgi:hypothetical protein
MATSGSLIRSFDGGLEQINAIAFSPDGRRAVAGGGLLHGHSTDLLKLLDGTAGQLILSFVSNDLVAYSIRRSCSASQVGSVPLRRTVRSLG